MTMLLLSLLLLAPAERPGYFGLTLTLHSDATSQWMYVHEVNPAGPAARAGLGANDVITAIDGKPLHFRDFADVVDFLSQTHAGTRLRFSVIHGKKKKTITVKADPMSDTQYEAWKTDAEAIKRSRRSP
jgi:S1-C subfamily serine protease